MPLNTENLIQRVYDLFADTYTKLASDRAFLAFEPMGIPLSDGMFKLDGQAGYSQPLSVERLSEIADKALIVQDGSVLRGMETVEAISELLLTTAQPVNADAMVSVGQAKQDAKFDITLGSMSGVPDERFHPVYATPADWYIAGSATCWTTHTLGDSLPAPPSAPEPVRLGPPIWRVLPAEKQPVLATPISMTHPLFALEPGAPAASGRTSSPVVLSRLDTTRQSMPHPLMAMAVVSALPHTTGPPTIATPPAKPGTHPLGLIHATTALTASTTATAVTTDSISMSFEHCIVLLDRQWFPDQLVLLRNWYLPGYARGNISAGTGVNDRGLMPILATGFVAIRNLKITSKWAAQDLAVIQSSAAFGPFSLVGRSFDQTSGMLSSPAMQIIGWFCSALPVLPPASDPALTPESLKA